MTDQLEGQMSLSDLDTWFGRTFQEPSPATKEKTSSQSSRKSSGSSGRMPLMFLYLTGGGGAKADASWEQEITDARFPSLGDYTMRSFGESPKEENASHLSQILEASAPQKYYLSARACQGILNRAKRRCKELPEILRQALENQIANGAEDE